MTFTSNTLGVSNEYTSWNGQSLTPPLPHRRRIRHKKKEKCPLCSQEYLNMGTHIRKHNIDDITTPELTKGGNNE